MSDEVKVGPAKRAAMLEFWEILWRTKRQIAVFGNTEEAMSAGLPTLGTMSELARRVTGVEVKHYGMGCFGAKNYKGEEIFGFCGGGAMLKAEAIDCSYTFLDIKQASRRLIIKLMRELCPKAFAYVEEAKAQRKAERLRESEEGEESSMMADDISREIYEAALEVLKDMDTIGASEEASVVRLQKAVDAAKGSKS